jgi:tetratricopeptide (TPR) repeat protein
VIELATSSLEALPDDWVYEQFGNAAPASVYDRCWLVMALAEVGRFPDAAEPLAEAFRLSGPMHQPFTSGMSYWAASTLHILRCDWAKARPVIEDWIPVVEAGEVALLLPLAITSFAWVLAQVGEAGEASKWLREGEQLLERQAERGGVPAHGLAYYALGRTCLLLGRLDDAQSLGDRAIDFSPGHRGIEAHALHLLGDIASHPDRFDAQRGEAQYRRALALAEPRDMRPLVAHCHLGLGKLYSRAGKHKRAIPDLAAASTLYRELDMEFWLEQTQQQSPG